MPECVSCTQTATLIPAAQSAASVSHAIMGARAVCLMLFLGIQLPTAASMPLLQDSCFFISQLSTQLISCHSPTADSLCHYPGGCSNLSGTTGEVVVTSDPPAAKLANGPDSCQPAFSLYVLLRPCGWLPLLLLLLAGPRPRREAAAAAPAKSPPPETPTSRCCSVAISWAMISGDMPMPPIEACMVALLLLLLCSGTDAVGGSGGLHCFAQCWCCVQRALVKAQLSIYHACVAGVCLYGPSASAAVQQRH
jgi:hypothetical protein